MTTQTAPTPAPSFGPSEIAHLIQHDLPEIAVLKSGSKLADLQNWLSGVQGKKKPTITHPRISLFLAGYREDGSDMLRLLDQLRQPHHALSAIAAANNADFQVHELGRATSDDEMLHAVAYGMMAAAPGIDLLVLSLLNPAHEAAADRLLAALQAKTPPVTALLETKSMDIAACFGAMISARLARIPVIADGKGAAAAIKIITSFHAGKANHIMTPDDILQTGFDLKDGGNAAFMIPVLKNIAALAA